MQLMTHDDPVSDKILRELQRDGRVPNTELAKRVGLSPSACLRRVQDLENRGVIDGYRAIIRNEARGIGFIAYVSVGLSKHSNQAQKAFEHLCQASPAVRECHNITGSIEYLLRVEVNDLAAYKQFHSDVLGPFPWLATITTHVVMDSPKDERA